MNSEIYSAASTVTVNLSDLTANITLESLENLFGYIFFTTYEDDASLENAYNSITSDEDRSLENVLDLITSHEYFSEYLLSTFERLGLHVTYRNFDAHSYSEFDGGRNENHWTKHYGIFNNKMAQLVVITNDLGELEVLPFVIFDVKFSTDLTFTNTNSDGNTLISYLTLEEGGA